jgi:Zn-dependent protease with chaperone function
MLETLLVYFGESQREGRIVTRRMRWTIILSSLSIGFFVLAFFAAIAAGAIYMAENMGPGPAALVIAAGAFLFGVFALIALAVLRRPRRYAPRPGAAVNSAPLALQSIAAVAMQSRPITTLAIAAAMAFITTRSSVSKRRK